MDVFVLKGGFRINGLLRRLKRKRAAALFVHEHYRILHRFRRRPFFIVLPLLTRFCN